MYGLLEPVALAVHLEDVTMMHQAIQQSSGHSFSLENLYPFTKCKIAGNQQAAPLITVSKDLEQKFGSRTAEGKIRENLMNAGKVETVILS